MDNLNKFQKYNLTKPPREVRRLNADRINSIAVDEAHQAVELERENRHVSAAEIDQAFEALRKQFGKHDGDRKVLEPGTTITEEMCRKVGVRPAVLEELKRRANAEFEIAVQQEYRRQCETRTPDELNELWQGTSLQLIEGDSFLSANPTFFEWNQNWNWQNLIAACKGLFNLADKHVATIEEMKQAHEFCLQNRIYATQPSYKRSEQHLRNALRPFSIGMVSTNKESAHDRAMRKVNSARLPAGVRLDQRRAEMIGLDAEEFNALVDKREKPQEQQFRDLQTEVRAGFIKDRRAQQLVK